MKERNDNNPHQNRFDFSIKNPIIAKQSGNIKNTIIEKAITAIKAPTNNSIYIIPSSFEIGFSPPFSPISYLVLVRLVLQIRQQ